MRAGNLNENDDAGNIARMLRADTKARQKERDALNAAPFDPMTPTVLEQLAQGLLDQPGQTDIASLVLNPKEK